MSQYQCDQEVCSYSSEMTNLLRMNREENYSNGFGFIKSIIESTKSKGKNWLKNNDYRTGDVVIYDGSMYVCKTDNNGKTPGIERTYWNKYQLPFFNSVGQVAGSGVFSGDGSTIRQSNEIVSLTKTVGNKFELTIKKDFFVDYPVFLFSSMESLENKFYHFKNEGYDKTTGVLLFSIWSSDQNMDHIAFEDSLLNSNTFSVQIFGKVESVGDIIPPQITLIGSNPTELNVDDTYNEEGATAVDDVDGDLTSSIIIDSSSVDTSIVGSYVVSYTVSDSSGNIGSKTRTVNVSVLVTECSTWNDVGFTTSRSLMLSL